ncbi:MAG: sigma-70 family RNA polymerase sigma factor [Anaerolineales bacterium]|nr:sigma-70 family RNA polymerase sigma factor [Anaerolineales bacterium]
MTDRAMGMILSASESNSKYSCYRAYAEELHLVINGNNWELINRAFIELYNILLPVAYNKGNRDQVEDCVQQTLTIVWEKRSQCRKPGSFLIWTKMILINVINQIYRKTRAIKGDENKPSDSIRALQKEAFTYLNEEKNGPPREVPSGDPPVDSNLEREEAIRELLEILSMALGSDNQRAVLVGLFIEDRSPIEIAKEIGCTVSNVYVLKSRAITKLKKCPEAVEALKDLVKKLPPKEQGDKKDEEE